LQAAFLRVKLKHLDEWNARRRRIAQYYFEHLKGLPGLALPQIAKDADPVWHLFVIASTQRDALQAHLEKCGIGTLIHYPVPPHLSEAYADLKYKPGDFPITEQLAGSVLSLPIGPHLKLEDAGSIAQAVREFHLRSAS
jgi:dTDP-4-amino-4,6-dideoxygalactose transaminase